jgi:hypothetical protein
MQTVEYLICLDCLVSGTISRIESGFVCPVNSQHKRCVRVVEAIE